MNLKQEIDELKYAVAELQNRVQRQQKRLENHIDYHKPVMVNDVAIGYRTCGEGVTGLQSVVFQPSICPECKGRKWLGGTKSPLNDNAVLGGTPCSCVNPMKKLKSLKEHNDDVLNKFVRPSKNITGIACPECGKELRNSGYPVFVECSQRIQFPVHCPKCGWSGSRY
jgi:predicted RNA-binding Zn-ribbon protein involved in translation (DUF1610 family)